VLQIATGGGKTTTALISAVRLQDRHSGPFLVVVLVPTRPLIKQWTKEVQRFGLQPILPAETSGRERTACLQELRVALSTSRRRTDVMILSNALFGRDDGDVRRLLASLPSHVSQMLIADEVHNLGVPSFLNKLPADFNYRIGLSATPVRQYDTHGTEKLFEFFGPAVFEFSLDDAIRAGCLTPYAYYLHEVVLTNLERDKYVDLSERLRRAGFRAEDDGQTVDLDPLVEHLLRQRRAILEQAQGKLAQLRNCLQTVGPARVRRTLIYTSAKPSVIEKKRQLEQVNALLSDMGIIAHQLTNVETADGRDQALLDAFSSGEYQVLTAMKVLDEGVDIPHVDTAFILASSTVRREWVQRRGRILRRSAGKLSAAVHDFLVVPPDASSPEVRSIIRSELSRAEEFASCAENQWLNDGPRAVIRKYEAVLWQGGS
jgi:superfamily II DNA or RNA helicase